MQPRTINHLTREITDPTIETLLGALIGIFFAVLNWQLQIQLPIPGTPYYYHHVWTGILLVALSYWRRLGRVQAFLFALGVILIADDAILHAINNTNLFW